MKRERDGMVATLWKCVDLVMTDTNSVNGAPNLPGVMKWLEEYNGIGKYYVDNIFGLFYFELDEDREMFLLRWS